MKKEIWKDIEGYPNYQISNYGRVYSRNRGKMLSLGRHAQGYLLVQLHKQGVGVHFYVHRLVARAFINNPLNKPEINHINSKKDDNSSDNLEWVTRQENTNHASANNLGAYRLTKPDVIDIIRESKNSSLQELANKYGVTKSHISNILKGKRWRHVTISDQAIT